MCNTSHAFGCPTSPSGGGNHDLEVIRDGDLPEVGNSDSTRQYDTYDGGAHADDWIGYHFDSPKTFSRIEFQEGKHFDNGGWFDTAPYVEVEANGMWQQVENLVTNPRYQDTDHVGASARSFETFFLSFESTIGTGIRLRGTPGGSASFISVGELRAFAISGADC